MQTQHANKCLSSYENGGINKIAKGIILYLLHGLTDRGADIMIRSINSLYIQFQMSLAL